MTKRDTFTPEICPFTKITQTAKVILCFTIIQHFVMDLYVMYQEALLKSSRKKERIHVLHYACTNLIGISNISISCKN